MSFGGLIQTINGRNELAKAELGGKFEFMEILLGDGEYTGSFTNKESLEHTVLALPVSSMKRKGSEVIIESDFNSKSAPKAFYLREIGITANNKLCYYDNAGADAEYIDPETSAIVKQKRLRFVLAISSGTEVTVTLAEGLYALDEDLRKLGCDIEQHRETLEGHMSNGENPHNVTKTQVGLGNVPNVSTEDQTPAFTQAENRENIESGEKTSTLWGKVKKFFADLKPVAFSGKYGDLEGRPSIPAKPGDIGLGNVDNTADANKNVNSAGRLRVLNDNYRQGTDLPSTYPQGEVIFFSNNPPTARFNGIQYCTIHTIKGYSNMACIQFLYPYNSNEDRFYFREGIYPTDSWRPWYEVITSKNIGSQSVNYAASAGSATSATKATQDGDGNNIANTYAKQSQFNGKSLALCKSSNVSSDNSVALGHLAKATSNCSTALGYYASASDTRSISLGSYASASGGFSTALGDYSSASGDYSTVLGHYSHAENKSTAIGSSSSANARGSVALGSSANVSGNNSTALGYYAATSNSNSIQLGNASNLSSITARVAITVTSDERDKADITEMDSKALDFLKKVKAIRYVFNSRELYIDEEHLSEEERRNKEKYGLCSYDREEHAKGTK